MISLLLKSGVSITEICDQLAKSASSLYDAPAVFSRVLKTYMSEEDYTELHKGKPCPDCGKELRFKKEAGCMTEYCDECNYSNSKCG
jgi:formamidopyrimidine-DNA glycosylase